MPFRLNSGLLLNRCESEMICVSECRGKQSPVLKGMCWREADSQGRIVTPTSFRSMMLESSFDVTAVDQIHFYGHL